MPGVVVTAPRGLKAHTGHLRVYEIKYSVISKSKKMGEKPGRECKKIDEKSVAKCD